MSAGTGYSAGEAARRLGVAVTTLRTWHMRYGIGPDEHQAGRHRRYTEQDLQRLEAMQRLVADGVTPAEAARWVSRALPVPTMHDLADDGAGTSARGLTRAALRLDAVVVRQWLSDAVSRFGVVSVWQDILCPVLIRLGERHLSSAHVIAVEHLLSACVSDVFGAVPRPAGGVPVRLLLACAEDEQHSLPVEAVAAGLAAAGVPARMLGPRLPTAALLAAVRRTGPAAVLLWSQQRATANPAQLAAVMLGPRRPPLIAAAGPGWDTCVSPRGVTHPRSLAEAVEQLAAAAA